jgi:hypothetical protein
MGGPICPLFFLAACNAASDTGARGSQPLPIEPYRLETILHSLKSLPSHAINKCRHWLEQLWQHESFDHIVRNERPLERFRKSIVENQANANGQAMMSIDRIV